MQIRKTKILTMTILTIVYSSVIGLIVISYFAKDEGTLGNGVILNFLADNLYFLAIPTFILISVLAKTGLNNIQFFSIGILISGLVYAILTVLIYSYLQRKKNNNNSVHKDYNEEQA
jgi:predicted permease